MKEFIENLKRLIVYNWIMICDFFYKNGEHNRMLKVYKNADISFLNEHNEKEDRFEFNNMVIHNNQWGKYKVKEKKEYKQFIYSNSLTKGWKFDAPIKNYGVIGYPEISIGKSPFGGYSSDVYFPKKVNSIKSANVTYDVDMYVDKKKYNLTLDMWITDGGEGVRSITNEVMIWEDRNVARPFGKYIGTINIDGDYKVYNGYMDRSSENFGTDGWQFTAFVRVDRRRSGFIDIKKFIDYMKVKNIINEENFLSTIEFGNEVYNSSGSTIVKKYYINKS
jgi:hypothetical protein